MANEVLYDAIRDEIASLFPPDAAPQKVGARRSTFGMYNIYRELVPNDH